MTTDRHEESPAATVAIGQDGSYIITRAETPDMLKMLTAANWAQGLVLSRTPWEKTEAAKEANLDE